MLIIFDLDDTLIDTTGSLKPILFQNALKKMIDYGLDIADFQKSYNKLFELSKKYKTSEDVLIDFLKNRSNIQKYLDVGIKEIYTTLPQDAKIEECKGASKILKYLISSHTLALVSVGDRDRQFKKMEKAGIDYSIFCKIIISQDRNKKPWYKEIFEANSFPKEKVLVCGDKVDIDLHPAKELGFTTVWKTNTQDENFQGIDFIINELEQLLGIVKE